MKYTKVPREYEFLKKEYDRNDPDPWLTLYLDTSAAIDNDVKAAWLADSKTISRQFLLPFLRPIARIIIVLVQIIKAIIPNKFTSSKYLHMFLAWALKNFATPEANWLILRHFWIGTENLAFLRANIKGTIGEGRPLKPKNTNDLKDDLFLKHDINLFNLIADVQLGIKENNHNDIERKSDSIDFSMISSEHFDIDPQPCGIFNIFDLQTCIDLFTPIFQLFITDSEFWRSVQSLQLDETIALYMTKILNSEEGLILVNNKHPLVVPATLTAGYRLVLHGLASEILHQILKDKKRLQENS